MENTEVFKLFSSYMLWDMFAVQYTDYKPVNLGNGRFLYVKGGKCVGGFNKNMKRGYLLIPNEELHALSA